jgi:hypothetical protein
MRHKDMVAEAMRIYEEFERKCSLLQNAYNSVRQRVNQGYKLCEGVRYLHNSTKVPHMRIPKLTGQISSVLSVEQNENISKLTRLTIIYLGPALSLPYFIEFFHYLRSIAYALLQTACKKN